MFSLEDLVPLCVRVFVSCCDACGSRGEFEDLVQLRVRVFVSCCDARGSRGEFEDLAPSRRVSVCFVSLLLVFA